jgi:hypothetical protein
MIITTVDCGDTSCLWRYPTDAAHHSPIICTYAACGILTVRRMWSIGVESGVVPLCPPKMLRGLTWEWTETSTPRKYWKKTDRPSHSTALEQHQASEIQHGRWNNTDSLSYIWSLKQRRHPQPQHGRWLAAWIQHCRWNNTDSMSYSIVAAKQWFLMQGWSLLPMHFLS